VHLRVHTQVSANAQVAAALEHINWKRVSDASTLASRLVQHRALLFASTTTAFMHRVFDATAVDCQQPVITVDRIQLAAHAARVAASAAAALRAKQSRANARDDDAHAEGDNDDDIDDAGSEVSSTSATSSQSQRSHATPTRADVERRVRTSARTTVFGAALPSLSHIEPRRLRPRRPLGSAPHYAVRVVFANENVQGEVGPYRQFFTGAIVFLVCW
jgi:hypothetical protein